LSEDSNNLNVVGPDGENCALSMKRTSESCPVTGSSRMRPPASPKLCQLPATVTSILHDSGPRVVTVAPRKSEESAVTVGDCNSIDSSMKSTQPLRSQGRLRAARTTGPRYRARNSACAWLLPHPPYLPAGDTEERRDEFLYISTHSRRCEGCAYMECADRRTSRHLNEC
jgi:hypothetical protein